MKPQKSQLPDGELIVGAVDDAQVGRLGNDILEVFQKRNASLEEAMVTLNEVLKFLESSEGIKLMDSEPLKNLES